MEGSSLLYATTLPGLLGICIAVVQMFLIYPVISCDHIFKGLCDLMG